MDSRNSQTYKTVTFGNQTWMAQNLNYTPPSGNSWCYHDSASNCATYGRLYDYPAAMSACPTAWHLPTITEWNTLVANVGGTNTAGNALKSMCSLWTPYSGITSTDDDGFSALPGGSYDGSSKFSDIGYYGYWWTATANTSSDAYTLMLDYNFPNVSSNYNNQVNGFSVRCVKDSV